MGGAGRAGDAGDRRHPPPHLLRAGGGPGRALARLLVRAPQVERRPTPGRSRSSRSSSPLAWLLRRRQLHGRLPDPGAERRLRGDRQHDRRRRAAARPLPGRRLERRADAAGGAGGGPAGGGAAPRRGLPFGLRELWRRYRREPFALLFGLAAIGFFATLALRLAPPAWETGNRPASSSSSASPSSSPGRGGGAGGAGAGRRTRPLLAAGIGLVLVGGAISGWPWDSQLARPLQVSAAGATISSPPLAMAEWARGPPEDGRFAASTADAGLLLDAGGKHGPGRQLARRRRHPRRRGASRAGAAAAARNELRYIVVDRREIGADSLRGYYFPAEDRLTKSCCPASASPSSNGPGHRPHLHQRPDHGLRPGAER